MNQLKQITEQFIVPMIRITVAIILILVVTNIILYDHANYGNEYIWINFILILIASSCILIDHGLRYCYPNFNHHFNQHNKLFIFLDWWILGWSIVMIGIMYLKLVTIFTVSGS